MHPNIMYSQNKLSRSHQFSILYILLLSWVIYNLIITYIQISYLTWSAKFSEISLAPICFRIGLNIRFDKQ